MQNLPRIPTRKKSNSKLTSILGFRSVGDTNARWKYQILAVVSADVTRMKFIVPRSHISGEAREHILGDGLQHILGDGESHFGDVGEVIFQHAPEGLLRKVGVRSEDLSHVGQEAQDHNEDS